jgi:CHAT domain-containing protein
MLRLPQYLLIYLSITVCILIFLCQCNIESSKPQECIDTYRDCNSLYQLDSTYSDLSGNLLYARWLYRKGEFEGATEVLDSLEKLTEQRKNEDLYQDIILYKFLSFQPQSAIDLNDVISQLNLDLSPSHNINMLYFKARLLRARQEINYSFACTLYAEYLRSQLNSEQEGRVYFLPWSIHAVSLVRESADTTISKYYIQKSIADCENNSPGCRWMKTLLLTLDESILESEMKRIRDQVIDKDQFTPVTDKRINTHLNYVVTDNEFVEESLLSVIDTLLPLDSDKNFYNTSYLIDAYLEEGDVSEAEMWVNRLFESKLDNIQFLCFALFRKQKLLHQQYLISKDRKLLIDLYECSIELLSTYAIQGKSILNEHYADAIYRGNNIFIETLFNLSSTDLISKDELLNHLNNIKSLYNKISDSRSMLGNKGPTGKSIEKINKLKHEIEIRELAVNRYMTIDYPDMSVSEELYNLHKELYELKDGLPDMDDLKNKQQDHYVQFQSIADSTQIIDYIQTDSSAFLSRVTNGNVEMLKLSKKETLKSIAEKKTALLDPIQDIESNYLDSMFSEVILDEKPNIIFVPDGDMFDFPIEILMDDRYNYLTQNFIISYASQISEAMVKASTVSQPSFLAGSYSNETTLDDRRIRNYPELIYGNSEIEQISQRYKAKELFSGYNLTSDNLFRALDKDIVHLSSHSSSSATNPLANYILVRDEEGKGVPIYGFTLKSRVWDTELVVLSSCETGLGAVKPGAGIFSLSRDLMQAGAKTIVKSLWKVNEKSTLKLMTLFHNNLSSGQSVAEALRNAKLELKTMPEFAHPFYWSGFVLEGNSDLVFKEIN